MDTQINATMLIGKKLEQSQRFNEKGQRLPVTVIEAGPCNVVQIKTREKDGYTALQVGFGIRPEKNTTKPEIGHIKKAGINKFPRFLREIKVNEGKISSFKVGDVITVEKIFTVGDTVDIVGTSRGKGFTGVVKRHHFKGGPRTHGQSDRERAPGSIGQTTTPGRVYKGKRMAGRSGSNRVTVKNLKVVEINKETNRLIVSGVIPGTKNGFVTISKTG